MRIDPGRSGSGNFREKTAASSCIVAKLACLLRQQRRGARFANHVAATIKSAHISNLWLHKPVATAASAASQRALRVCVSCGWPPHITRPLSHATIAAAAAPHFCKLRRQTAAAAFTTTPVLLRSEWRTSSCVVRGETSERVTV